MATIKRHENARATLNTLVIQQSTTLPPYAHIQQQHEKTDAEDTKQTEHQMEHQTGHPRLESPGEGTGAEKVKQNIHNAPPPYTLCRKAPHERYRLRPNIHVVSCPVHTKYNSMIATSKDGSRPPRTQPIIT